MIDPSTSYIVMLAGDTQQEDGSWVSYNRKMLDELLKSLPKNENILILSGPRTGKHLENTNKLDESAHKTETDYITRTVQAQGIKNWKIVDFKYGEKSLWDSALHFCIIHTNVGLVLPGESTSMISEVLSLGILPIVYEHKAMTPGSHKYLKQLQQEGRILEYPIGLGRQNYSQTPSENQIEKIVVSLRSFVKN
jgi:hypothetical protein